MIGKGKLKHKVHLADFELSTQYVKGGKHITD